MWPGPMRVLSQLQELINLLREQNALLRELIQFHTRRPPQTPMLAGSGPPAPLPRTRPRTASDISVVTRDVMQAQAIAAMRQQLPHMAPETLTDLQAMTPVDPMMPGSLPSPMQQDPTPPFLIGAPPVSSGPTMPATASVAPSTDNSNSGS